MLKKKKGRKNNISDEESYITNIPSNKKLTNKNKKQKLDNTTHNNYTISILIPSSVVDNAQVYIFLFYF
jgi:predicted SPOUT superfamily RNA methylase MTH1